MIRLDKYVEDQNHNGETQLVVRSNNTATALNEAGSLELLEAAGLATQQATPTAFSVNGSDAVLRLVIQNPDGDWNPKTSSPTGCCTRPTRSGDYSYRGDDAEAYTEAWDQEAGPPTMKHSPPRSANTSTSPPSPKYMAIEDLLENDDDIDGPGNNSYLDDDPDTGVMTVVAWDHNPRVERLGPDV